MMYGERLTPNPVKDITIICISFTDDAKRFSDIKFMVDKKDAVPQIKDHAMMIEWKFRKFLK